MLRILEFFNRCVDLSLCFVILLLYNQSFCKQSEILSISVNCHTSRISEFVDFYLQLEVKKLKSYVKDTAGFIKKIEAINHVSDDSYLVSLHVRSLYTNIPHKEEIEAVKQKLT